MARKTREDRIEYWASKIQPSVAYCLICQPRDSGEYIWVFGDQTQVSELLYDRKVPEDLHEEVADRLRCGNCGDGGFSVCDDIGLHTSEEREYAQRWRSWKIKYSEKLDDFGDFLSRYPYLGAAHRLGREIRKMITDYDTEIEPAEWWRARRAEGARRFATKDMLPPDESCPVPEGRFNHYGQRVFYLAGEDETALAETLDHEKNEVLAWVQKFNLPKIKDVLDLIAPDWCEEGRVPLLALGLLSHMDLLAPPRDSPWKPEYFVPRYIADCAREAGFKAIRFRSTRAFGTNLVLFEWEGAGVNPVDEPQMRNFVPREPEF
ncbi:MAG: RES family NAD+ phosphorylase [Planctomycetota bacterium]